MSLALILLLATAAPFTEPEPWALGFAAPPRIPFVGDVNGDGYDDMIVVYPTGKAIIDVSLSQKGMKAGIPFQALNPWGTDCQGAAVGEFDGQKGADVIGLFDNNQLRLAGSFEKGKYKDQLWLTLPKKVRYPALGTTENGKFLFVFSNLDGVGYKIEVKNKTVTAVTLPQNTIWIGDSGKDLVAQNTLGEVFWMDRKTYSRKKLLGRIWPKSRAGATNGLVVFGKKVWTEQGLFDLEPHDLPQADIWPLLGDMDGDGDTDILEFRYGKELHTANQVLIRRQITRGETDNDHDGLTNSEELKLGTNPNRADSDNDGLLDGWEVNGFRGLDLKGMGCNPLRVDLICLISRFDTASETRMKSEMERVHKFYAELDVTNPDGSKGFSFHPIYLPVIPAEDHKNPWWQNRAKYRDEKLKGVVHWMQITPGGGGQADQLGDGGTCGENSLWAVFTHEFGHQLGLSHEGFWPNSSCPIYGSMMNYNYSYSFEDDRDKIHYSNGSLANYILTESNLDEIIPLPYEKVKFLEKGPYRFRLKPNGNTTLIDWNWNGIFGEKGIRADINYAYSTHAGRRDDVGKSKTSPWLFVHKGRAIALFGNNDKPADKATDPTLSPNNPGQLILRRLISPYKWENPQILTEGLTGDPIGFSYAGKAFAIFQTAKGVWLHEIENKGETFTLGEGKLLSSDSSLTPSVGEVNGRPYLLLWNPADGSITYSVMEEEGLSKFEKLNTTSKVPPGITYDTVRKEAVLALAQDQGEKTNRWQIRRYKIADTLVETGMEWVEGEQGNCRGTGRLVALFEKNRDTGPEGRVYIFGRGLTTKEAPWACTYVAHQIADKTVRGGWLVKRYYDEWTQSRSAPAAAWFNKDIIWAYRWVDGAQGPTDNNLHVGYKASGIQDEPFGDHDDIGFLKNFGIRNSILYLGAE